VHVDNFLLRTSTMVIPGYVISSSPVRIPSGDSFSSHVIGREASLKLDECERELLKAANGATVGIDWLHPPDSIAKTHRGLLVIVNQGHGGHLTSYMIRRIVRESAHFRLACCVVNFQGVSGVPVSAPSASLGLGLSFVIEMKAVTERIVQHLGDRFPKSALGLSLSGLPLIEYLGQDKSSFTSAVVVSTPLDFGSFSESSSVVTRQCVAEAKSLIRSNADVLTEWNHDATNAASGAKALVDIHNSIVMRPIPSRESLLSSIDAIETNTLMMYALDDPSVDFHSTDDMYRICTNERIAICVTGVGGHCSSVTVNNRSPSWLGVAILEFVTSSMRPFA
jgi:predicted alpha/beta-fold hydrolase